VPELIRAIPDRVAIQKKSDASLTRARTRQKQRSDPHGPENHAEKILV
jgi:hypothetical protein